MLWPRSLITCLVILPLMAMQACGFEPVYGKRTTANYETATLLSAIEVQAPPGKLGELFKAHLEDHFNPKGTRQKPFYRLKVSINTSSDADIIEQDGTASRYTIKFSAPFQLIAIDTNQEIEKGSIMRLVSYNVSQQDDYSTFIAREDAQKRGMVELAEDYNLRIGAIMHSILKQQGL